MGFVLLPALRLTWKVVGHATHWSSSVGDVKWSPRGYWGYPSDKPPGTEDELGPFLTWFDACAAVETRVLDGA